MQHRDTSVVLTVIALCLVWICVREFLQITSPAPGVQAASLLSGAPAASRMEVYGTVKAQLVDDQGRRLYHNSMYVGDSYEYGHVRIGSK